VSQFPRFSASLIGLRSLGFVGGTVGTANVGFHAPACPPPLLLWRCARGGPLPYTTGAPDQGADRIGFLIRRSRDYIPNIEITSRHCRARHPTHPVSRLSPQSSPPHPFEVEATSTEMAVPPALGGTHYHPCPT
jgi:hypothetical protein